MIFTGASNPYVQRFIEVENFWPFLWYFVQDCLLNAQRALAVLYEDRYPCSNWVQQGLKEILYQRCNGSHHEFNDNFLRPTIALLERLKEQVKYFCEWTYNLVWRFCWQPWRTCMHCIRWSILFSLDLSLSMLHFSGTMKYGIYRSMYFADGSHRICQILLDWAVTSHFKT